MTTEELRTYLEQRKDKLTRREIDLVTMRFGLEDGEPKSLDEVAQHFGITRERVRQIEHKVLYRPASHTPRKKIADYYK